MTCGVQLPPAPQIKAAFTINRICNVSAVGSRLKQPRNGSIRVAGGTAALPQHPDPAAERRRGPRPLAVPCGGGNREGGRWPSLPDNRSTSSQRTAWKGGGKGLKQPAATRGFPRVPWVRRRAIHAVRISGPRTVPLPEADLGWNSTWTR